jgi:hypothetical protein
MMLQVLAGYQILMCVEVKEKIDQRDHTSSISVDDSEY